MISIGHCSFSPVTNCTCPSCVPEKYGYLDIGLPLKNVPTWTTRWECPKCNRVFAPNCMECSNCNKDK